MTQQSGIQINKYISSSGYCSRREADKLIEQGRVTLNGRPALPISRVFDNDRVAIDDETMRNKKKEAFYIVFNKPKGITSTTDLQDRSNIISFINHNRRIFPVGRLDKDSEGLILLTDDGDIVNKILRVENGHEKEYIVTLNKPITGEFVNKMSSGVPILDTITLPCKVRQEGNKKFRITLTQGLNRQIRRMCEYMGYEVVGLKRIRIMHIRLGDLAVGKFRKILPSELNKLQEAISASSNTEFSKKPDTGNKRPNIRKSMPAESGSSGKNRTRLKHGMPFTKEKSFTPNERQEESLKFKKSLKHNTNVGMRHSKSGSETFLRDKNISKSSKSTVLKKTFKDNKRSGK